ncbi:unnamed protein product [Cuscuta epithymum]|uniref:HhH-GPD domain-containing protein n=1 Tax=Cuscuta epithymum TaxID=186058 RepID=A0AAV0CY55_9ASTE|nr:unnamed protein product [Cuscuta epithymum]
MSEKTPTQTVSLPDSDSGPPTEARTESPSPTADSGLQSESEPTLVAGAPLDISRNHSNPSKIPIRPRKIRKLSAATFVEDQSPPETVLDPTSPSSLIPLTSSASTSGASTVTTLASSRNRRKAVTQISRLLPQIVKPLSADGEIELAIRHLRASDPLLVSLIDTLPPPTFETRHPPFLALAKSILYQQLAYKAGTSIYTRFISLCGGELAVHPDTVLSLSAQQLKQIGVSGRKASYLYDLANKYKSGILSDDTVVKMDDRSLFTMLSMVKGIGSWSVHMFMIFSLHRPDVLPVSDLGVRKGVQLLHGLEDLPRPSQMEQLCVKWKPYRSVGAWYMWRFVEGKGTPASAAAALDGSAVQPLHQIDHVQDAQEQHQLQLMEPINGITNLGYYSPCGLAYGDNNGDSTVLSGSLYDKKFVGATPRCL